MQHTHEEGDGEAAAWRGVVVVAVDMVKSPSVTSAQHLQCGRGCREGDELVLTWIMMVEFHARLVLRHLMIFRLASIGRKVLNRKTSRLLTDAKRTIFTSPTSCGSLSSCNFLMIVV